MAKVVRTFEAKQYFKCDYCKGEYGFHEAKRRRLNNKYDSGRCPHCNSPTETKEHVWQFQLRVREISLPMRAVRWLTERFF